jgi:diguanylate cyclase (GGDEF)-like protein
MNYLIRKPVVLIAILGALLTTFVSWQLFRAELKLIQQDFAQDVQTLTLDLEMELRLNFEVVYSLYEVFSVRPDMGLAEFQQVAGSIYQRHPDILALEWIPRIDAAARPAFEAAMRALYGDYRIWQPGPDGDRARAQTRAEHYPVQYLYPLTDHQHILGLDINFGEARQRMLQRANEIRGLFVSDPIDLVREKYLTKGFFALIPLYADPGPHKATDAPLGSAAQPPIGYVRAVFRVEQLLGEIPQRRDLAGIRLILTDTDTDVGFETLFDSHPDHVFEADDAHKVTLEPSPGRSWALLAAPADPGGFYRPAYWTAAFSAAIGFIVTLLLTLIMRLIKRHADQVEILVEERTQDLFRLNQTLAVLSFRDSLTGVANRRSFDQAFQTEWRRAARLGSAIGIAILDVDWFRGYKEALGHQAGDDCLKKVALTLRNVVRRPGDLLARFGGEEFVLLLPDTGPEVGTLAEACRIAVEDLHLPHPASPNHMVTLSVGITYTHPHPGEDPLRLLRAADEALFEAKSAGRNHVVVREMTRVYAEYS